MLKKFASTKKVEVQAKIVPRALGPSIAEIKAFIERWRADSP